jgi:hypothetical protein
MQFSTITITLIAAFASMVAADNCFQGYRYCDNNFMSKGIPSSLYPPTPYLKAPN